MKSIFWNAAQHRVRAAWRLLLALLLFYLLEVIIAGVGGVLLLPVLVGGATLDQLRASGNAAAIVGQLAEIPAFLMLSALASLLAMLAAAFVAAQLLDRRRFADFGFHFSRGWWLDFAFGLVLGAALMGGIFLVERAAGWVTVTGLLFTATPGQPFLLALLTPLVTFICVGIYEELMSRGYLLRNVAEGIRFGPVTPAAAVGVAWLASSAVFGWMHHNNPNVTVISLINLVVAGLFLGLGYILTGELAISIGAHMAWNFFQGNVFGFPVSGANFSSATFVAIRQGGPVMWTGGAFGPEGGLLGVLAMVVGALLIALWVRARRGGLLLCAPLAVYERPLARHNPEL
jgi:membrane protease YdiL (CAAX protease family)